MSNKISDSLDGGPEMAPMPPSGSERPGAAVAPLETREDG
jgi:hypothetical protein